MRACSIRHESDSLVAAIRRIVTQPCDVFIAGWNWKAALWSAGIRGLLFCAIAVPKGTAALRGAEIEVVFRIAMGGCWGSLMQELRHARPAWLAGALVAVVLPAGAHVVEYAMLKAGGASHIRTGMSVSVIFSIGSVLANFSLMRRGLMLTGEGAPSLSSDLRRMASALGNLALSMGGAIGRVLRVRT
jgi:hypothetical protein